MLMMLTALFALCGGAAAQQVRVTDIEALPGETISLTMQLDTDGGSYTGLEFDIQFPSEGFTTTGSATTTATWDGAFTIGDVGGVGIDNLARCGVLSYSETAIPGTGLQNLGTVEFTVGAGVALGNYTVTLTNMTLIGDGRVSVAEATFTLSVVAVHTIILDENATIAPEATDDEVNVQVKRTISAGNWNTICLPFAMTAEQVTDAFGTDVKLADFTGYTATEDDETGGVTGLVVHFKKVEPTEGMEANHPYLMKVSEAITSFTVDGVTLEPEEDPTVAAIKRTKKQWSEMIGTYAVITLDEQMLFLSGNKFYYSDDHVTMKGYRAYFDFYDVLTDVENGVKLNIMVDGEETHIGDVKHERVNSEKCFDLMGRKVRQATKGVYIMDGRKVMVK